MHTTIECPFCSSEREVVAESEHSFAIEDIYPVVTGHLLVIPRRHVGTVLDLSDEEYADCMKLVRDLSRDMLETQHHHGVNIGVNSGEAAGQTIYHAHVHVFPRNAGDVDNPRGGIRHIIPEKGSYQ